MIERKWGHDELQADLAFHRNTLFQNVCLGSPWVDGHFDYDARKYKFVQRADVVNVLPSYTRFCLSIYEVKISRADFQSDIRSGKWRGYLNHCHRFYFATPVGMVSKTEIPEEAGLIVRGPNGWKVLKQSAPRKIEVSQNLLLALLFYRKKEYKAVDAYRRDFAGASMEEMAELRRIYRKRQHLQKRNKETPCATE